MLGAHLVSSNLAHQSSSFSSIEGGTAIPTQETIGQLLGVRSVIGYLSESASGSTTAAASSVPASAVHDRPTATAEAPEPTHVSSNSAEQDIDEYKRKIQEKKREHLRKKG